MNSDTTATWTPLTLETITPLAQVYGAGVHGDAADGSIDVEFHDVMRAVQFAKAAVEDFGWAVDLRAGDVVSSLWSETVVLTVRP